MPRPSKRAKASEQTAQSSSSAQVTSLNKGGITGLPSELLLEIVSYFPVISIDDIRLNPTTLAPAYRERFASLRALSQMCKDLREVCLPLAWERLEACTTATGENNMFYKEVGNTLERKCNGLAKSKHLLSYVRYVASTEFSCATLIRTMLTSAYSRQNCNCDSLSLPDSNHPPSFLYVPRRLAKPAHNPGRPRPLPNDYRHQKRLWGA